MGSRSAACALATVLCLPAGLLGQSAETLSSTCATAGGDVATCAAAAVAAQAVVGHIGLLAGQGSELPGEGSTLGRRLGGMPRIAAWVRGGAQPVGVPDPASPNGSGEASAWTPNLQAGLGLGVFDGFHLMPTVGGFLSLDVFGQASFLFLSDASGFDGRESVYSVGARVGILQESFTLPGVSVSASRRFAGEARLGDSAAGDPMEVLVDPAVTSIRATVSKDLFAFGVLAGLGWDDFSADTGLRVTDGATGVVPVSGSLDGTRRVYFGSITKQLGILAWVTVEGGWADGLDPVSGYTGTGHGPEKGSMFGSLTLLLKL
jgi:hypothetical protein